MNRETFVRLATAALRQFGDQQAAEKAEAIAARMDVVAEALGEVPATRPAPAAAPPPPFPQANPNAVAPVAESAKPNVIDYDPASRDNLIVAATTIPDRVERVADERPPAPIRSLRQPAGKMKVEDLNLLIQERTPTSLNFDVQMEDGQFKRMTFVRNVISMHNFDSVQLSYFPPNTPQAAREATQVVATIHIEELPVDLSAILTKLRQEAAESVRPKGQIFSAPPPVPPGPALSSTPHNAPANVPVLSQVGAAYDAGAGTQAAPPPELNTMGYELIPSKFHENYK